MKGARALVVLMLIAAASGPGPRRRAPDDLRDAMASRPWVAASFAPALWNAHPPGPQPMLRPVRPGLAPAARGRSPKALAVARWHDAAVAALEASGGYKALPPRPAVMLRLRLGVVESWFWRDSSGELFANPQPFSRLNRRAIADWTLPVQKYLRGVLPPTRLAPVERLYLALSK